MKINLHYIWVLATFSVISHHIEVNTPPKEHWLIIYIHGIIGIQPHLNLPNLAKFFRDKIAQSVYERTVELIRRDEFFYQHHPMQLPGLRKIDLTNQQPGACATAYAHLYEEIYKHYLPHTINHYYTFGWSGLLSSRMRHYEGKMLYDQLHTELSAFKKQNINPKICLITYSHGGNIALKLAEVASQDMYAPMKKLAIDKLIFIGLPVLGETDFLINSPIFKKIYHVYSYGDRVQPLDCFSMGGFSSSRTFKSRLDFHIPDKLVQIELRLKKPRASRGLNINPSNKVPFINNKQQQRTADPGHTELWSFGWSHRGFRESFPLYPLPAAILLPYLAYIVDTHHQQGTKLCVEIHPYLDLMKWTDRTHKKNYYYDFIPTDQLNRLKNIALAYKPTAFSTELHDKKIAEYKRQARLEWLNRRNIKRFGGIRVAQVQKC